eukprot:3887414-Prorocentrum_lima.AAC.1
MNTSWDVIDLIHMVVDTYIMETGDDGPVWQVKLHYPHEMGHNIVANQTRKFSDKWEKLRPDVNVAWST